jgi:hypothetical protein
MRGAGEVGERGFGVVEEHDPEAAEDGVETSAAERMYLRVGLHELDVAGAGLRCPPASEVEHWGGDVDAHRDAAGADAAGGVDGQGPVPASRVK